MSGFVLGDETWCALLMTAMSRRVSENQGGDENLNGWSGKRNPAQLRADPLPPPPSFTLIFEW